MENGGLPLCLIINNKEFRDRQFRERHGAEMDNVALKKCFKTLGFKVIIEMNQTCEDMKKVLNEKSKEDHSKRACFVCVLMSHGDDGMICGTDGTIHIQELICEFYNHCHISLKKKPKLFFIQACRGSARDTGEGVELNGMEPSLVLFDKKTTYRDFLLVYATPPGFVSYRHRKNGSYFIQKVCDTFMKDFKSESRPDILRQLTRIHWEISQEDIGVKRYKQIPCFQSTLNADFFWKRRGNEAAAKDPYIITQRKLCIIINIKGSKEDTSTVENAYVHSSQWNEYFKGFEINKRTCTSFSETKMFLTKVISKRKKEAPSCLVCVLLCEFKEGEIRFAVGNNENLKGFANLFRGDQCSYLIGKPKLFFIQEKEPVDIIAGGAVAQEPTPKKIPVEADFLYCHGFPPKGNPHILFLCLLIEGFVSYRHRKNGSYFIQKVCDTFMKDFKSESRPDILRQLTRIHWEISQKDIGVKGYKQIPCFQSTLNADFFWKRRGNEAAAKDPYIMTQRKLCIIINIKGSKEDTSTVENAYVHSSQWNEYFKGFEINKRTCTSFSETKRFLTKVGVSNSEMSKSYQLVDPLQPGQSKAQVQTDWNKCVLCQKITRESLQCPAESKRHDVGVGYFTIAFNIRRFNELHELPMPLELGRLDDGNGIEATFLENNAKWHKSCHTKFNNIKLQRAEKRKCTQGCDPDATPSKKYTRQVAHHEVMIGCLFFMRRCVNFRTTP
uniref:uncharacterized protein n=1 Tax=Myxine glutinosa TaxID=7769 RepID=UPI00358F6776